MPTPGVYAFEDIDEALRLIPLAARRALDALGYKLSLEGWLSLALEDRTRLVRAGAGDRVDLEVRGVVERASPAPARIPPAAEVQVDAVPEPLTPALERAVREVRPAGLDVDTWRALRGLDRYALAKYAARPDKLAHACREIFGVDLTHLTHAGEAHMVDVADKAETRRRAIASACLRTTPEVVRAIDSGRVAKGDVLAAARIAGILAAKRTAELVPLCHPVRTTRAAVEFEKDVERGELHVRAIVEALDRTGVEMEAMVAASVASLTIYDMIKSADRWAVVDSVRLEAKSGGKSGDVARPADRR